MAKGIEKYIGTQQYCTLCGRIHYVDHVVETKRKTLLFFSSECFEKECNYGKGKRSSEGKTD